MGYRVILSRQAQKDVELLRQAGLLKKAKELLDIIRVNPFHTPPPCEKLTGDLQGMFSRRINIQHRLVYDVIDKKVLNLEDDEMQGTVHVLRMWRHYG